LPCSEPGKGRKNAIVLVALSSRRAASMPRAPGQYIVTFRR
jgi:hypothetical protein